MNFIKTFIYLRIANRPNLIKIINNISWLFLDNIIRIVVGLCVSVWIVRYFGPELFGVLSFAISLISLFSVIVVLGLDNIVLRNIVAHPNSAHETLGTTAALQFLSGLIAYPLILITVTYMRPGDALMFNIVAILGSALVLKSSDIAALWFASQTKSKYQIWVKNIIFLVFSAVKVALILHQASLISFVLAMLVEAIIASIIMLVIMNRYGKPLAKLRMRVERAKILMKDSWPLILSSIAITIYMKIDQIMLGLMIGDEEVGIYSVATRISEVWYFIPTVIMTSVFPTIFKFRKNNKEQYYAHFQRLLDLMTIISVIVALPMTFLSTYFVTLLFGEVYSGAGSIVAIHIWASIFVFMGVVSNKWFLAENNQLLILQRTVLGAFINIVLNFFLIPVYGSIGAALATIASYVFVVFFLDSLHRKTRKIFLMKVNALNLIAIYKRYK